MPIPVVDPTPAPTTRFAFGEIVVLYGRTKTGTDAYGNDVFSEDPTVLQNVPVWPRASSELVQGQDTLITGLSMLLPVGTSVAGIDKVEVYGDDYEVDGEPGRFLSPFTGLNPGVLVNLTRITG